MNTFLLDADVVIALATPEHDHHEPARRWFASIDEGFLCPIVEGALLRFLVRSGESATTAESLLVALRAHPKIGFVADGISYVDAGVADLRGHRQLTDAYLAALAHSVGMRLATFDAALSRLRPAWVHLIETPPDPDRLGSLG